MSTPSTIYNYFSSNIFLANTNLVFSEDNRLNAEYYEEGKSLKINTDVDFVPLSSYASVVFPGIFKRYLVDNTKNGIPFLTTSDMMMLEPETDKNLSVELTDNLDIYRVSEHTLLVSRSGTIGNTIYVDDRLKDFALTEDALRVNPFDDRHIGFLYFYFISEYGNNSITGKKSGAVIDHIYEDDLLKLPVPQLNEELINSLFKYYLKVKENRELAHKLINKARFLVLQFNNLLPISELEKSSISEDKSTKITITNISEVTHDFRLDAHFYNPVAKTAISSIERYSPRHEPLKEITKDIIIGKRFKRNYVHADHGTPFIGSKNILQIRPSELKYLSNSEIAFMDDLILQKGMILIACSGSLGGTFGRNCLVHNNFEGYAASQHILRIVVDEDLVDPAYLYAFLSSDYGYECITRFRWGALIDEIDDNDMSKLKIPLPNNYEQQQIGDLVRQAYDLRANALCLEDEAQGIINQALTEI